MTLIVFSHVADEECIDPRFLDDSVDIAAYLAEFACEGWDMLEDPGELPNDARQINFRYYGRENSGLLFDVFENIERSFPKSITSLVPWWSC